LAAAVLVVLVALLLTVLREVTATGWVLLPRAAVAGLAWLTLMAVMVVLAVVVL
jgi:hypothetical protein